MPRDVPGPGRLLLALGLGSNEAPASTSPFDLDPPPDPRARALEGALVLLRREGWLLRATSPIYETSPHGVDEAAHAPYLNACALLDVPADLEHVLERCEAIERLAGRTRKGDGSPRPLDLDLLAAWRRDAASELVPIPPLTGPRLQVPHPRLAARAFVLVPLAGVAPEAPLVVDGRTLTAWALLRRLARDPGSHVAPGPASASFPWHAPSDGAEAPQA